MTLNLQTCGYGGDHQRSNDDTYRSWAPLEDSLANLLGDQIA